MVAGWAELVQKLQQDLQGGEIDPDLLWTEFQDLAARSPHADALQHLVRLGQKLPARDRSTIAMAITGMLAPVEWPEEWEAVRGKLVNALGGLTREANPLTPDSLAKVLGPGDRGLEATGWAVLRSAHDLLRTPCRRDELRIVAHLCNVGTTTCVTAYRRALKRLGERAADEGIVFARRRYSVVALQYAQAAREINEACGTALFEAIDAPLEDQEP